MTDTSGFPGSQPAPFDNLTREAQLLRHKESMAALVYWKAEEMRQRLALFTAFFPNAVEGMNTVPLGNGYELKAEYKFNYVLDSKEDSKATDAALTAIEGVGEDGKFVAERLVKWKPELSISEYRKLNPKHKALIDRVLKTTPGSPTLSIKEPKA